MQNGVPVQIRLGAPMYSGMQIYYCEKPDEGFNEAKCISVWTAKSPAIVDVVIPVRNLDGLRLDFGSAPGEFTILGGQVGDIPLPLWKYWAFSSDVTLKSTLDEPGGLTLFSDKIDPYMYVLFRRSIPSGRIFNLKRLQGVLLLLTLAMVMSLATQEFFYVKLGVKTAKPPEHVNSRLSLIFLLLLAVCFFFVGIRMASCGCDMWTHISMADNIDLKELLSPLDFWKRHSYPMWHLLVKAVKSLFHLKSITFAAGLVNGFCYNACMIGIYIFLKQNFKNVDPCVLIGLASAICICGPMLGPWLNFAHVYENTYNSWHNPTNAMTKALALPCVLLTVRLINQQKSFLNSCNQTSATSATPGRISRGQWSQILILGFALVLTELAKPSFIQVYIPAVFLFFAGWFLVDRKSLVASFYISSALILPILVLLVQYLFVFDTDTGGSIGFGFMKVVGHYRHSGLNQFYAVAFPVAALIVAIKRRSVCTEDILCWLMLLVGMFMKWFLFEHGLRMMHGNLGWGYGVALYLVWVTSIRQYVDLAISQNSIRESIVFWLLSAILILHVLTGFYKLLDMVCLGSFR